MYGQSLILPGVVLAIIADALDEAYGGASLGWIESLKVAATDACFVSISISGGMGACDMHRFYVILSFSIYIILLNFS